MATVRRTTARRAPGPPTRDRMIETTGRLMRDQGFHATGLNQIVAEADAPKGSMYFHFPGGKVDLAAAAITEFADQLTSYLEHLGDKHATTADSVAAFIDATVRRMERSDFHSGCVLATVALETAADDARLGDACSAALTRWTDNIAAGLRREGWKPKAADDLALLAISAI